MRKRRTSGSDLVALVLLAAAVPLTGDRADAGAPAADADAARFFESKVRPVLVESCIPCHGPAKQKSGLRLDSLAGAAAGGGLGPAVVPGKPDESLLVAALAHGDDAPKMPPSKKLPDETVADLTRWVAMGAPWPGGAEAPVESAEKPGHSKVRRPGTPITDADRAHWAFQPVRRPVLPALKPGVTAANPVDSFVQAGLSARGFTADPPAPRHELIRRATYDLTGLPPTPAEVDAFCNDASPVAYEALIDRLLASPRYGEKWGRHWLDLVRYAETNSYERDGVKPNAWRYRDYVIRSFNQDMPYDQFLTQQLAGDEVAPGDVDALIATGYYRLGIWDDEPTDRDQARFDGFDDLVATTGGVFMGMTVDCARCHDHKIDPITQKDYYRLVSFFRNVNHYRNGGPTDETPLFADPGSKAAYESKLKEWEGRRDVLRRRLVRIEDDFLAAYDRTARDGLRRRDLEDLRYAFYRDTFDHLPDLDALRPEDAGALPGGLFDLAPRTRDQAYGFRFDAELVVPEAGRYTFDVASDDGARLTVAGRTAIEHDGILGVGRRREATVVLPAGRLPVRLEYFQNTGDFGLDVGWSGPGFARRPLSVGPDARKGLDVAAVMRKRGATVLGAEKFKEYQRLERELGRFERTRPTSDTVLCVTEEGREAPPTFVMLRGNPHVPGDPVEPGFLTVLGSPPPVIPAPPAGAKSTGRRTALAGWLCDPANPLTARVMANRVWQYHFGRGLVRSSSNFGVQGDRPTHPELLDWLAAELVSNGWRLKPLHRLIMTSDAYRMSSRAQPEALAKDPANDALWRFDMRRLTAEEVRDTALAVSGELNPAMGGPGVYPEIPAEVMAGQSQPGKGWGKATRAQAARRSVYVHAKRSLLLPILESFDQAETDRSSPVRFSTTQPTQALAMLNGKFLNDQAAAFAARLRREAGPDPDAQITLAWRLATAHAPSPEERRRALALLEGYPADQRGEGGLALKALCLVVLNLNETVYLD